MADWVVFAITGACLITVPAVMAALAHLAIRGSDET